jgi:hypothetical protein
VDTGREIRAYRHGESMAQDMRADSLLGGKLLRGLAVGKWESRTSYSARRPPCGIGSAHTGKGGTPARTAHRDALVIAIPLCD